MSSFEAIPDNFAEDFSFLDETFTPVETPKLPDYTPLAEFDLGPDTLKPALDTIPTEASDANSAPEQTSDKFTPISEQERLSLIRRHVRTLFGEDAELIADEFLINSREDHRVTHLSVGKLATGEAIIVASDDNPHFVEDAGREKSTTPSHTTDDDEVLSGEALTQALESQGENGRGFMIATRLAADGVVHVTKTHNEAGKATGKNLWVAVRDIPGNSDHANTELAA